MFTHSESNPYKYLSKSCMWIVNSRLNIFLILSFYWTKHCLQFNFLGRKKVQRLKKYEGKAACYPKPGSRLGEKHGAQRKKTENMNY